MSQADYDIDNQLGGLGKFITFSIVDNVNYEYIDNAEVVAVVGQTDSDKEKAAAVSALMALGYSKTEAMTALIGINAKSTEEYIAKAQNQCKIDVVGRANKPSPKVLLEYLKSKNIAPENAVMVGDRPLTDILAGQFARTKTILVDSITRKTEAKIVRFVRALERITVKK